MCQSASIIQPPLHWLFWAVMQGLALRVGTWLCTDSPLLGYCLLLCLPHVLVAAGLGASLDHM